MAKRSREDSPPSSPDTTSGSSSPYPSAAPSHTTKYVQTAGDTDNQFPVRPAMKCSLPPHAETLSFPTFSDFEVHYAKIHSNRCSACNRNLPTEHFLSLHISENHDPLEDARRARDEKTYRCFVEGCEKICSTPQKRRMHLVDKHMFPKNYDFLIVNTGIDKRSSMLRTRQRRTSSAASRAIQRGKGTEKGVNGGHRASESTVEEPMEVAETANGDPIRPEPKSKEPDIDELTSTMSALKFVPPSVRFGRGERRGGLSRS